MVTWNSERLCLNHAKPPLIIDQKTKDCFMPSRIFFSQNERKLKFLGKSCIYANDSITLTE